MICGLQRKWLSTIIKRLNIQTQILSKMQIKLETALRQNNVMLKHSYDSSNHVPCMCVSASGLNEMHLVRNLIVVQRLVCLMISSAFPSTLTSALEIQLNITPFEVFLLAKAVRGSYRITVSGLWHVNPVGSFGKAKSHVDDCKEARRFLPLPQMPANRIKKTKVFERNFKCQIMENKKMLQDLKAFQIRTRQGLS